MDVEITRQAISIASQAYPDFSAAPAWEQDRAVAIAAKALSGTSDRETLHNEWFAQIGRQTATMLRDVKPFFFKNYSDLDGSEQKAVDAFYDKILPR